MVEVKTSVNLLAAIIVLAISVSLFSSVVMAQYAADNSNYWVSTGPTATVQAENATSSQWVQLNSDNSLVYTDNGNLTLRIHAGEPSSVHNSQISDVVRWWMGYLTSVSYRASWQGNQIVEVYTNTTGDNQQFFDFELTNVPYGNHILEVYVSYVVYTFGTQRTPVTFSRDYNMYNFAVASSPTSGQIMIGLSLEEIGIVLLIAALIVSVIIAFVRKHRCRGNPKAKNGGTLPRLNLAKVKMRSRLLRALVAVIILNIASFLPIATAQNSDSDYYNGDYWSAEGPIATVHWTNGTANQFFEINEGHTSIFLTDTANGTLRIHVDGPKEISYDHGNRDTLRCWMEYLTAVSYQASWENNKETTVYANTTDNQTKAFDFELTNIPYGNNTLELYASYTVSAFGPPLYSSLHMSTYTDYFFVVSPNTSTPTALPNALSISLEQVILVTFLSTTVMFLVLLFYRRSQRTTVDTAKNV